MSVDIQTILVATDFSAASEAATTYAFQLARALGVRVTLLHVVPESDVEVMASLAWESAVRYLPRGAHPNLLYRGRETAGSAG